jgi:hypothetical protein
MSKTKTIADAIENTFGKNSWLPGDVLKKARTKAAFSEALATPATQIKATDLKNLINQLWENGILEIIPPKEKERAYKFRLKTPVSSTALPVVNQTADDEKAILDAYQALRRETQFRHVYLSEIFEKSFVSLEFIHTWAAGKARKCEFELGQADWSLATKSQRDAAIKINGIHYLTIGTLS